MKPSIGRIIIVKCAQAASNGVDRAPAIITRVWGDGDTSIGPVMVNATAFPDLAVPQAVGSINVYDTEADVPEGATYAAFWPERV